MNSEEAMGAIESPQFCAYVNIASDFRTFMRVMPTRPGVKDLLAAMASPEILGQVFEKVLTLAEMQAEEGYEHPADSPMAAYLWLLSMKDHNLAEIAAEIVLGCERCWWARKVAESIRNAASFHSDAGLASRVLPVQGVGVKYLTHASYTLVPVQTVVQLLGRVTRPAPEGPPYRVFVLPAAGDDQNSLFRNRETRNRDMEVLAG
jgi:hypothetical protein